MRALKNLGQVLSTGYIFVYFSEHLFWARVRPDDSLGGWLGAWIVYSLMAFIFLSLIAHFHIRNIWALFLAGAAFGWIGEGVVVQTTYEMLPLSISFTGLAWHALITVWIGWYALRRSLRSQDRWSTLKLSTAIGLLYGLWAISWWMEPPPEGGVSSIVGFAGYSFATTGFVILAYWMADWSASESFSPNRWSIILILGSFALYFCFVTIPSTPASIILLPALLSLAYWGLRNHRARENEGCLFEASCDPVSVWKYLSLFAIPLSAVMVYELALAFQLAWHTNWVLYLLTTPLGFVLFGMSLQKGLRKKSISL